MSEEYIERGALLQLETYLQDADGFDCSAVLSVDIRSAKAADVVEVKHGEWDDTGRYKFPGGSVAVRCSECGCCLTAGEYRMNVWNYCPVCGARMDGGADNG